MVVRIGLHYGVGIVKSNDVFGDVVSVAARVESVALPGQVIISDSLQRRIAPSQFDVVSLGRFRLRGKSEDRDLFLVRWSEAESVPLGVAHTNATQSGAAGAKLQHLASDGSFSAEHRLTTERVTVDSTESEEKPADNSNVQVVRARCYLLDGRPVVESASNRGRILFG